MTIQIDDAGWGCLLGGTLIGAYHVEAREYVVGEIPVALFQGEAFARKDYLDGGAEVVVRLLAQLQVEPEEPIRICTGYVLEGARGWLDDRRYRWQTARITGPLQEMVETSLLERLHRLGLTEVDYPTLTTRQGLLFWHCLRWLKGGDLNAAGVLPERARWAKTGWANYPVWAGQPYAQARQMLGKARAQRSLGLSRS
jgi:hypothetical protein